MKWVKFGVLALLFAGAVVFYLVPQLLDHWASIVRLTPDPTPVSPSPPEDSRVNPAYVEGLVLDGFRYTYPHLLLAVECELKCGQIEGRSVAMAACWSQGQTECVFTSIRHFGESEDDFDMRAYSVEHASPTTVPMSDCFEASESSVMEADDCVNVITDFEAAQRLMEVLTEWESYLRIAPSGRVIT